MRSDAFLVERLYAAGESITTVRTLHDFLMLNGHACDLVTLRRAANAARYKESELVHGEMLRQILKRMREGVPAVSHCQAEEVFVALLERGKDRGGVAASLRSVLTDFNLHSSALLPDASPQGFEDESTREQFVDIEKFTQFYTRLGDDHIAGDSLVGYRVAPSGGRYSIRAGAPRESFLMPDDDQMDTEGPKMSFLNHIQNIAQKKRAADGVQADEHVAKVELPLPVKEAVKEKKDDVQHDVPASPEQNTLVTSSKEAAEDKKGRAVLLNSAWPARRKLPDAESMAHQQHAAEVPVLVTLANTGSPRKQHEASTASAPDVRSSKYQELFAVPKALPQQNDTPHSSARVKVARRQPAAGSALLAALVDQRVVQAQPEGRVHAEGFVRSLRDTLALHLDTGAGERTWEKRTPNLLRTSVKAHGSMFRQRDAAPTEMSSGWSPDRSAASDATDTDTDTDTSSTASAPRAKQNEQEGIHTPSNASTCSTGLSELHFALSAIEAHPLHGKVHAKLEPRAAKPETTTQQTNPKDSGLRSLQERTSLKEKHTRRHIDKPHVRQVTPVNSVAKWKQLTRNRMKSMLSQMQPPVSFLVGHLGQCWGSGDASPRYREDLAAIAGTVPAVIGKAGPRATRTHTSMRPLHWSSKQHQKKVSVGGRKRRPSSRQPPPLQAVPAPSSVL